MFVINNENTKSPIKIWLEDEKSMEDFCLEQAYHLSQLPFIHKWVSLMPDTHPGMGMPIGGVRCACSKCRRRGYWLWYGLCKYQY